MTLTFQTPTVDATWGCAYQQVVDTPGLQNVKLCFVEVTNLAAFAAVITRGVLDKSWMTSLDPIDYMSYDMTVTETANKLVGIFQATSATGTLGADFGELMVTMGSAYALEKIFSHLRLPIAELWKPKLSGNEGFDFHTTCPADLVNFGEAKYSSNTNPYTLAISQAEDFIDHQKHFRDGVHLKSLVSPNCAKNLTGKQFGIVAAFSIQGKNPDLIFANAAKSAAALAAKNKVNIIYLVGVK